MIEYDFGTWGVGFVFTLKGSIFPKSMTLAIPSAGCAVGLSFTLRTLFSKVPDLESPVLSLWGSYTFVLGFLLVFRTQIAYSRFWEGGSLLQKVKGVWFNATSNLIAFSSLDAQKREQVEAFHHQLIRLMSMLYCVSLQHVAQMQDENFEIIGYQGLNPESLKFLACSEDRCEVLMQWIQRLIVNNAASGVITIAPPILSRVFQELSNGIVNLHDARKITEFPFPFPYSQMLTVMLVLHWVITPVLASFVTPYLSIVFLITFVPSFALWSINYIAAELEMPFGDDANDLPIEALQLHFNRCLRQLMNPMMQTAPVFDFRRDEHAKMQPGTCRFSDACQRQKGKKNYFDPKDGCASLSPAPPLGLPPIVVPTTPPVQTEAPASVPAVASPPSSGADPGGPSKAPVDKGTAAPTVNGTSRESHAANEGKVQERTGRVEAFQVGPEEEDPAMLTVPMPASPRPFSRKVWTPRSGVGEEGDLCSLQSSREVSKGSLWDEQPSSHPAVSSTALPTSSRTVDRPLPIAELALPTSSRTVDRPLPIAELDGTTAFDDSRMSEHLSRDVNLRFMENGVGHPEQSSASDILGGRTQRGEVPSMGHPRAVGLSERWNTDGGGDGDGNAGSRRTSRRDSSSSSLTQKDPKDPGNSTRGIMSSSWPSSIFRQSSAPNDLDEINSSMPGGSFNVGRL